MNGREARIANNEAISRDINEGIEKSHNDASRNGFVRMMCECGQDDCERLIAISVSEYEQIRQNPGRFASLGEHVVPDVEDVVEDLGRYVIVEKRLGQGREVAEARNPRV